MRTVSFFVDKLVAMGARITPAIPTGRSSAVRAGLHGERLESPDIRAGMAMLIAAMCADGSSEIGNVVQIDRGYERIDERLRGLGARIDRGVAAGAGPGLGSLHPGPGGSPMTHPIPPVPGTSCPTRCASCGRSACLIESFESFDTARS